MAEDTIGAVAIIPARGGSKGIVKKNLRPVGGTPLIVRTIKQAALAPGISQVIVSTDDADIADLALAHGAQVRIRPPSLAGDMASSESALVDTLDWLSTEKGVSASLTVMLQCTSPFLTWQDIETSIALLTEKNVDVVFSAHPWHGFLWEVSEQGEAIAINHDASFRKMRQELPPCYQENGALYVMKTAGLLQHQRRFFGKVHPHIMEKSRSIDIDEPEDLLLADFLLREGIVDDY